MCPRDRHCRTRGHPHDGHRASRPAPGYGARAQTALTQWPYPDPSQRVAIAEHLVWMMDFLHHHHHAEGEGLYPPVRQRVPESIPVLDAMDADHQTMIPAIDRLDAAAKPVATDGHGRTEGGGGLARACGPPPPPRAAPGGGGAPPARGGGR